MDILLLNILIIVYVDVDYVHVVEYDDNDDVRYFGISVVV